MKGLRRNESATADQLRSATRQAFAAAVDFAIDEAIPLVVIAGDLFDDAWEDMATGLWVVGEFRRLQEAGIRVCLIRGNHDSKSTVRARIRWPENVFEFGTDAAETWTSDELGVAVHGQSFAARAETRDLAAAYPGRVDGCLNIGVLHTSLDGDASHSTYAPTSLDVLYDRGYDYWALGHIHKRHIYDGPVAVAYAGNMQGRHIRETGPKGGLLVTVDGAAPAIEFVPFDSTRWAVAGVTAEADDTVDDLQGKAMAALANVRGEADGRLSAVRVRIEGVTEAHAGLCRVDGENRFETELRLEAARHGDLWIERVAVATQPPANLDAIRADAGVLAMLLDTIDRGDANSQTDATEDAGSLAAVESLAKKFGRHGITFDDCGIDIDGRIGDWLQAARGQLLTGLSQNE